MFILFELVIAQVSNYDKICCRVTLFWVISYGWIIWLSQNLLEDKVLIGSSWILWCLLSWKHGNNNLGMQKPLTLIYPPHINLLQFITNGITISIPTDRFLILCIYLQHWCAPEPYIGCPYPCPCPPMPMGFGWAWVRYYCSWVGIGLCIPASGSKSESNFLNARNTLTKKRSILKATIMNGLLFVRSNQDLV
jgi:hypothetical protein